MVRKIIQLAEYQAEALEERAKEQGVSFAEMVRRLVDAFLRQHPVTDEARLKAMEAVGYARSGDTDVSNRHDDYLTKAYQQ